MAYLTTMFFGKTLAPEDAEQWLFRHAEYLDAHNQKDLDVGSYYPKLKKLPEAEQRKELIKIFNEHLAKRWLNDKAALSGIRITEVFPKLVGKPLTTQEGAVQFWLENKGNPKEEKEKKEKKAEVPKPSTTTPTASTNTTATPAQPTNARASVGTVTFLSNLRQETDDKLQRLRDDDFELTATTTPTPIGLPTNTTTITTINALPATPLLPLYSLPLSANDTLLPSSSGGSVNTTTTIASPTPLQFYAPTQFNQFNPPTALEMYPAITRAQPQYVPTGTYGEFFEIVEEPKAAKSWISWNRSGGEAVRVRKIDTQEIQNDLIAGIKEPNNVANAVGAYGNAILKKSPKSYDSFKEQIAFFEQAIETALSITGKQKMVEGALREQFYRGFLTNASIELKNLLDNPDTDATPLINAFLEAKEALLSLHNSKLAQSSKLPRLISEMTPEMELVGDKVSQSQFIEALEQIRYAYQLANLPTQKDEDLIKTHLSRWKQWAWALDALEFPQVPKNLHKSKVPADLSHLNPRNPVATIAPAFQPSAPPQDPQPEDPQPAQAYSIPSSNMPLNTPWTQSFIPDIAYGEFLEINDNPEVKKAWFSKGIRAPKIDTKDVEEALAQAIKEGQAIDQAMTVYCLGINDQAPEAYKEKIAYFEQAVAKAVKIVGKKANVEANVRLHFYYKFIQSAAEELKNILVESADEDATPLINAFLEAKSDLLNLVKTTLPQTPEGTLVNEMKLSFSPIIPLEQIRAAYLLEKGKDQDMAKTHLSRWKQWAWVCQAFKFQGIPNNLHKKTRPVDFSAFDQYGCARAVTEKKTAVGPWNKESLDYLASMISANTGPGKKEKKREVPKASPYKKSYIEARFKSDIQVDELKNEAAKYYGIRYRLLKMVLADANHPLGKQLLVYESLQNQQFDLAREVTRMEQEGMQPMLEAADETLGPILKAAYNVVILLEGNASNDQLFQAIAGAPDELFTEPALKKYLTRQARAEGFEAAKIDANNRHYTPIIAQAIMAWFDSRLTAYADFAQLN